MVKYYYRITNEGNETNFKQLIRVGTRILTFQFQWAIISEEQNQNVEEYLRRKANTDPILRKSGNYDRDYSWFEYYNNLIGVDLDTWVATAPELPISVLTKSKSQQINLLNSYIEEAKALSPIITLYTDLLKWGFTMQGEDIEYTVGLVQPGGWYHNQNNKLSFRFTSELPRIDVDTIDQVIIEFEVYDE